MNESAGGKRKSGREKRAQPRADAPNKRDTILIHGVSEQGDKLAVLRAREDRVEAGVLSRVKDGEPLHGELLRLTPRADFPLVCDVDVELADPRVREGAADRIASHKLEHGGPAQVATERYRANWDAIWSGKKKSSALN